VIYSTRGFPCLLCAIVLAAAIASCGPDAAIGAAFRNLDFESAVVGTPVYGERLASQAVPGWTTNNYDPGYVLYDTMALDSVCVSIHDGKSGSFGDLNPLDGRYSLLLQRSSLYAVPPNEDAWIAQTGNIPNDATCLMFSTESNCGAGFLVASLNGTAIPMSLYSVGDQINQNHGVVETFIGDIRLFAGQPNVELRFTGSGTLDDIQFSSLIAPEPSALVLLVVAALAASVHVVHRRCVA
jgi:hypothetical protein